MLVPWLQKQKSSPSTGTHMRVLVVVVAVKDGGRLSNFEKLMPRQALPTAAKSSPNNRWLAAFNVNTLQQLPRPL
jgi:hypothetical protein